MWLGDYLEDGIVNTKFTTVDGAGLPVTLSGTPAIVVYKGDGTTEITGGITLTPDHDAKVGTNHVKIDLSADAAYVPGEDYQIEISAGTVDGGTVIGYVPKEFSIENRSSLSIKAVVDAIKVQTDKQVYTVANQLDVNVKSIDDDSAVVATIKTIYGSAVQIGIVGAGIHTDIQITTSDITGPLDSALAKSVLQFITGNNAGRKALISGNTQATGLINLEVGFELLTAPIVGDIFIIP